jgi:thiol-disulfide isomerase/thioredoxin
VAQGERRRIAAALRVKAMGAKLKQAVLTWAVLIGLFASMQWFVNRGLATGAPPAIHGATLDGKPFAGLETLRKPAVIYFWASWCGICRAMQDTVRDVGRDAPLMTVALQSGDATEVGRYLKKAGFDVPVVLDEDGAIGKTFGLRGVPAIFILGPDGNIRFSTMGYTSAFGLRVRLWLAGL